MLSRLQNRKLTRAFDVYDHDGDGMLTESDFRRTVEELATVFEYAAGSAKHLEIESVYMKRWQRLQAEADRNKDGAVSLTEFLAFHERAFQDTEAFSDVILGVAKWHMSVADEDGNGILDESEVVKGAIAIGLTESDAREAFHRMDQDGDGRITRDEFLQRASEFYLSDDPDAPGNWLFGPF